MFQPRKAGGSLGRLAIPAVAATALTGGVIYYRQPAKNADVGGQAARSRKKRDEEGLSAAGIGGNATSGGHETGQVGSGVQEGTGDVERKVNTTAGSRDKLPSGGRGGGVGGGGNNTRAVEMSGEKRVQSEGGSSWRNMFSSGSSNSGKPQDHSTKSASSSSTREEPQDQVANSALQTSSANASSQGGTSSSTQTKLGTYPPSARDMKGNDSTRETQGTSISQKLQGVFGQGGGKSTAEDGETYKKFHDTKIRSNHADTPTKRNMQGNAIGAPGRD